MHVNDGDYPAQEELERKLAELEAADREDERPLLEELAAAGWELSSVWDLVNERESTYPELVPILLEHLDRDYPDGVLGGIARALGVPAARPAWQRLAERYERCDGRETKDGLAVALSILMGPAEVDRALKFVTDTSNGMSRVFFIEPLVEVGGRRAIERLKGLASDTQLKNEIVRCLSRKRKVGPVS